MLFVLRSSMCTIGPPFPKIDWKNYFISWEIIWFKWGPAWGPVRSGRRWHGDIWYEIHWHDIIPNIFSITRREVNTAMFCCQLLNDFRIKKIRGGLSEDGTTFSALDYFLLFFLHSWGKFILRCITLLLETSFSLRKKNSFLLVYKGSRRCKSFPKWRWLRPGWWWLCAGSWRSPDC